MSKVDEKTDKDSNKDEEDFDDFKIPKNKKAKKKLEKLEREQRRKEESEKKHEKQISISLVIGDDIVVSDLTASISSKLKRRLEAGEYQKSKKSGGDREKLTYAELQILSPEEFDYENYDRVNIFMERLYLNIHKDWCRYCGARYSSNFTKGPW